MSNAPRVFISYSHDSPEHKQWVANVAAKLRSNGVDVILDQWDLNLGADLTRFMEDGVSSSDRVLVICTDNYVAKANAGKGGVGYERMIVTAELVKNSVTDKFIPMIRQAKGNDNVPLFLATRYGIDFGDDANLDEQFTKLLREIHRLPPPGKPPLGNVPFTVSSRDMSPTVTPSVEEPVQVPVIESVAVDPETIFSGGIVTLTVRSKSIAPVNWLNLGLDGPRGNLHGGGSGQNFSEVSSGIWELEWKYQVSKWAPSGVYTFSGISVMNEAQLTSAIWPAISFSVDNSTSTKASSP